MPAFLQNLLTSHAVVVAIALFTALSTVLTAVGAYLQAIGDKVPGWLGSAISGIGSVIHFLNGIGPSSSNQPPSA